MCKKTARISWYVEPQMAEMVRCVAKSHERTLSAFVTIMVKEFIKEHAEELSEITKNNSLIDNETFYTPYCLKIFNNKDINLNIKKKEINKEKRKSSSNLTISFDNLPECISETVAQDFIAHRRSLKKPMGQTTFNRQMLTAMKIHNDNNNLTADDAILQTMDFGWASIKLDWLLKANGEKGYGKQDNIDFQKWEKNTVDY